MTPVIGTLLNVLALLVGGTLGLLTRRDPSPATQKALKIFLGVFVVWTGLKLCWQSLNGTFWQCLGQLGIAVLALSLGHATGNLLRLQRGLNRLGQFATRTLTPPGQRSTATPSDIFLACTVVFAANPLGLYGALLDGTLGRWEILAIKAVMDGLSAMAFARLLGWPVLLSALPVLAFQGSLALVAQVLAQPALSVPMLEALGAAGGLLVFSVSLIVFDLKKIRLADYLPAFVFAPLLAWWLRGG